MRGGTMNEFTVELFIENEEGENTAFSSLSKNDTEHWKKDMELRALSEYYKQKVKLLMP